MSNNWIPKDYFPAVMFAKRLLKEGCSSEKAVSTAAGYYKVDPAKLEEYAGIRQEKKTYRHFVVQRYRTAGKDGRWVMDGTPLILRGLSGKTVGERIARRDLEDASGHKYTEDYRVLHRSFIIGNPKGYPTKEAAYSFVKRNIGRIRDSAASDPKSPWSGVRGVSEGGNDT